MAKRLINIMTMFLVILVVLSLVGCATSSKKVSGNETFEEKIDAKLINITNPKDSKVSLSSNPYDYVKGGASNEDYKYIVSQGEKSLNHMLNKFANSNKDGLEEYIMAIACSEILKENPASKNWSSGREWYNNYLKQKIESNGNTVTNQYANDYDTFIAAMKANGYSLEEIKPSQGDYHSFFDVPAKAFKLNSEIITLYEFSNSDTAKSQAKTISKDGSQIGGSIIEWINKPHFYLRGKIIVGYIGSNKTILTDLSKIVGDPITDS